ncbi:hypothetical protein Q4493_15905 [Colwellia sp. 1_MG-2023]|uniref:hypothetical protein n=1 Tax=Colwellia sp. 1_MG-2023 TaxID=3062649 RepID=UPI0026E1EF3A|nr:hypothetical protein [Colwellia sp. 1_MG-2023]MDO6447254.1 hypothetical protein [Colwellia sp. 1_MG-2023]
MSLPIDQVIAYMMTVVSVILFIIEKRKNSKASVYMSLQGLLKASYAKFKMHQSNYGLLLQPKIEKTERPVTLEEHLLYVQMVSLDYEAQMENILGIMKSLEIKEDSIFNKNDFTGHEEMLKDIRNRKQQA